MNEFLDVVLWMEKWNKQTFCKLDYEERRAMLVRLFKFQIKTMEALELDCLVSENDQMIMEGLDPRKVYRLAKMQKRVIRIALKIGKPGLIPFLPVLPRRMITTYNIVMRLSAFGERWIPALNLNKVSDVKNRKTGPHEIPYFIFNIDEGNDGRDHSPQNNINRIKVNGFRGMNLAEALAYQMHTRILNRADSNRAFIHACGSTYKDERLVPGLHIDQDGCPGITWSEIDNPKQGWNCPSYQADRVAISWQGIISLKAWLKLGKWRKIRKTKSS
jgi:hypothetical protein